jgi:putative ABC transport system permease protein
MNFGANRPERNSPVANRPLWLTAARRIQRRPLQYILLVIGVALGVAMMVSIDVANSSASRAFSLSTEAIAGRTTHRIVGGPGGLDEAVYRRLRTELGFTAAAPVIEGYVLARELGEQPLRLVGVDPFAEPPFRPYWGSDNGDSGLGDGLTPFLTEPQTVILSQDQATRAGIELGQPVTLAIGGREWPVRVVGLLRPADESARRALEGILFTDVATAQEMLAMHGRLSHIDLIIRRESDLALIAPLLPAGAQLEPALARSNALQQMTAAFELNLTALSLLALVVGMFLIYNTVTFSVVQRRPLFGVLRALGVTGGQLFGLIVTEAALFGLIGTLLGLALGVLLGRGMVRLVTQTINDLYFVVNVQTIYVSPLTLVKGLVIGLLAAVSAAILPAWEAMGTVAQTTLRRSALESKTQRLLPWFVLAWLLLGGLGVFLLWLPGANLLIAFTGLFAVLIAFALLTGPLLVILMRLAAVAGSYLFGALGRMAPRDIVRSLSRTSVATAALMVAVSVIVGVSIMIGSFRQTVSQWLAVTLQADVYLSPPTLTAGQLAGVLPPDTIETAVAWPGVEYSVSAYHLDVMAPELGRPVALVAVSGDVSRGNRAYLWIDGRREQVWPRLDAGEGVLISEPLLRRGNLGMPPRPLTLMTDDGPRDFPVLAVFYDYTSDQGTVLIGRRHFATLWQEEAVTSLGLFLAPGHDADAVVAGLQAQFGGRQDVIVQSNQALRGNALDIFDRTFAITAALQLLATVVAFIGVLSALMSLQLERARELGVLRATGMTLGQLWRLTLLETGLMGLTAGLMAMPVGWVLAWILTYVINLRSFGWTLQMSPQPGHFAQAFLVALVAALLAGVYPAWRLGRMEIATAVRQE